jgi:hypothetical protein
MGLEIGPMTAQDKAMKSTDSTMLDDPPGPIVFWQSAPYLLGIVTLGGSGPDYRV